MEKGARYKVHTRYGWFSLDEASYRDYLSGKLTWIDWPPLRNERKPEAQATLPPNVSQEAVQLRDKAGKQGLFPVLQQFHAVSPSTYKQRMGKTHIEELNLSVRSSNGLLRAGVDTFGKLDDLINRMGGIASVRNLGTKSVKEIQGAFLESCYYKLLPYEKAEFWQDVLDANRRDFDEQ